MHRVLRNIAAVLVGLVAASVVNMGIVALSGSVIAPPAGADMTTVEGVRAAMPRMTPIHFLFPFLAHALGTLAGGLAAALTAASHKMRFALAIGVLYLVAGIVMVRMVGGPTWFIVADLVLAYVPMGWLGGKMGIALSERKRTAPAIA